MPVSDRLEDWPPTHRELLSRGLPQRFVTGDGTIVWEFAEIRLDPFHPSNSDLYRSLRLGIAEAIVLVMRTPRDPKHLFEVVGLHPPADGLGVMEYRAVGTEIDHELIVRRACAYTRGSMVIGELQWIEGESALDRIVNPLQARRGRERQEIADALDGLRVMSNITKRKPGPAPGTVERAKYSSVEEWHSALRTVALAKPIRSEIKSQIIDTVAGRLSIGSTTIGSTTVRRYMKRWGPKTPEELRNGKWSCPCHSCGP